MQLKKLIKRIATGLVLAGFFFGVLIFLPSIHTSLLLGGILLYILWCEWPKIFDPRAPLFWIVMPFYPVFPFILLIAMNQSLVYRPLLLILFFIVASFDTGSYFSGKLFGKHKIAPLISPGKTWEGFFGGYLFAVGMLKIFVWFVKVSIPVGCMALFTLIICVLSLFGDLFESSLKRQAHLKDSGDILPGHGGFLDRFDGILFAIFFIYLFKKHLITLFGLI